MFNNFLHYQFFDSLDAQNILNIRRFPSSVEDLIVWAHEENGFFSVKSAYHLARIAKERVEASPSEGITSLWNNIWKLNVSNKLNFVV